jgi:O-antigen ligase
MDLIVYYKKSVSKKIFDYLNSLYIKSFLCRIISLLISFFKESFTYKYVHSFINRKETYNDSYVLRFFKYINDKSLNLRKLIGKTVRESIVFKVLNKSFAVNAFNVKNLIYIVVFYVFIDEIGRSILGSDTLFKYWDEFLICLAVLLVIISWLMGEKRDGIGYTPLNIFVIFYISVMLFMLFINSEYFFIGIEGFRVNVQYVLWFFIFLRIINSEKQVSNVYKFLVFSGIILAFHGLYQIITGVENPSSWTDLMEAHKTVRVFSIVESPNILGSLMILFIPMCIALMFTEKNDTFKILFGISALAMVACLIFTASRGAWFGFFFAVSIFILMKNPKLIIPFCVISILAVIFIPTVSGRIAYLFSPDYLESSARGGRLNRLFQGLELIKNNTLTGVGQGHFGGAVAMNNKLIFTDAVYLDNFWLKIAVETGIIGLIAFAGMIYKTAVSNLRYIMNETRKKTKTLMQGAFAGICGVIIHNLFENVFEVPYMVIYFWLIVAIIIYMGKRNMQTNQGL